MNEQSIEQRAPCVDSQLDQCWLALADELVEVVRGQLENVGRQRRADGENRREESAKPHVVSKVKSERMVRVVKKESI